MNFTNYFINILFILFISFILISASEWESNLCPE